MKKSISLIFIGLLFIMSYSYAAAQSTTPALSVTPTSGSSSQPSASQSASPSEQKDIENLKERLATKVEELRKKDQKAVSGFATVKDNKITVKDTDEITYTINVDSTLTKVYQITGLSKREIKPADLKTDAYLIASGPVVDTTVNANTVYVDEAYVVSSGKITDINKTTYTITVMTLDKDTVTLDIESSTKQNMLNIKTLEIETTGFSKIKEGDTIHFSAKKDAATGTSNKFSAAKILIIPQEYFMK